MVYVLKYLLVALATVFWGALACLVGLFDRSGEVIVGIGRLWIRWVLAICRVRVVAEGLENISPDQPYVFMTNHQSVFDIAALVATLPVSWRFVAKKELTWIPFFGWGLALGGHVIIDRRDRARSVRSLKRAAERVRQGANVIIFPEGTRSPSGSVGEFKSGGFHLAIEAQVPILPATVSGSSHITPKRSLRVEGGRVLIRYGKPIPTEKLGIEDRGQLKEQVRAAILAGFEPSLQ